MPSFPFGGQHIQLRRVLAANNEFIPDATTIGSRQGGTHSTGDADVNLLLDGVVQASGEGLLLPPGEDISVQFQGRVDSTCVIQRWDATAAGWVLVETITDALEHQFNSGNGGPYRIGCTVRGAEAGGALILDVRYTMKVGR